MPERQIKVLHLVEHLFLGGIERLLHRIAQHTPAERADLFFYTYMSRELGGIGLELAADGYLVFFEQKRPGFDRHLVKRLWQVIRSNQIEVIHTHDFGPMEYALALKILCPKLRLVHTQHTLIGLIDHPKYLGFFQLASWFYRHLHPVSDHVLMVLRAKAPLARFGRMTVIPNGVPPPALEKAQEKREATLKIINISRISPEKNLPFLLAALGQLKRRGVSFAFRHAGSGNAALEKEVKLKVSEYGLDGNVELLGFQHDLVPLMEWADVFVSPSKTEGHPVAVLEAMSFGKLCLLSEIPAHHFAAEEIALYFSIEDWALVDILENLSRHKSSTDFHQIGRRAAVVVNRDFSIRTMIERYLMSYSQVSQ